MNPWKDGGLARDQHRQDSSRGEAKLSLMEGGSLSKQPHDRNRDKIRCLDGLRGIACLIVFNYHFLWPWTNSIMLGYGAWPPRAPEPYYRWHTLPIVCLLHRGRPMVAIFFAISGFVLCRHILRAIHEGRIDTAYQKLASSVFRRVYRLYIPPTISMFLVAILAQIGAFKSEDAIYKGPDSVYINGTVTVGNMSLHSDVKCLSAFTTVSGTVGVAERLGLHNTDYLNVTETVNQVCLNITSQVLGPDKTYVLIEEMVQMENELAEQSSSTEDESKKRVVARLAEDLDSPIATNLQAKRSRFAAKDVTSDDKPTEVKGQAGKTGKPEHLVPVKWVQYGGSWEEHPLIHDNMTMALQNFTRVYAEWANPFNLGHYHTRYDPHTFTIPKELRGSMLIYTFLLATAAVKSKWRLVAGGFLSFYSLVMGAWDLAVFLAGAMLSEMDIKRAEATERLDHRAEEKLTGVAQRNTKKITCLRWLATVAALYLLSYPDAGAEYTPGYQLLSSLVPKYYPQLGAWMWAQSIGAVMLLPCVLYSSFLRNCMESRLAQYMGKLSFSFYLVHGPVLHSLGFWLMPRLFDRFGHLGGFFVGYPVLLAITLYLSSWWYYKIDVWSMTVGKRVEEMALT